MYTSCSPNNIKVVYRITLHRLNEYKKAQEHLEQSQQLNSTEKTLITWLRKNTEKLKELEPVVPEPVVQPATNVLNTTARHEWFQNENYITIEVFVKKAKQEDTTVDIFEKSVSFSFFKKASVVLLIYHFSSCPSQ